MNEQLKQYLWTEWRYNNIPKFYRYFDEWLSNLTEAQIDHYRAYSEGRKTPW